LKRIARAAEEAAFLRGNFCIADALFNISVEKIVEKRELTPVTFC
jgi:hypothetical protein